MNLKEIRNEFGLSQQQAADIVGIPLRTYVRYESDDMYGDQLKRQMIINTIINKCEITETKGMLNINTIKRIVSNLLETEFKEEVYFCYLFGSYAKGYAKENSDVDLCVSTSLTGFKFAGLSEKLHTVLHKNIDLIKLDTLKDNYELLNEIMKDGIKIYG